MLYEPKEDNTDGTEEQIITQAEYDSLTPQEQEAYQPLSDQ